MAHRLIILLFLVGGLLKTKAQSEHVQLAGDVGMVVLPATAFVGSLISKDKEGSIYFLKSFTATTAITYALKWTLDVERPDGGRHSFPSGHTSAAFCGASFIQKRYGWAAGIPAYAAASFVGYSRVHAGRHHIWDVVAGAAIGAACSQLLTRTDKQVQWAMAPSTEGMQLLFSCSF